MERIILKQETITINDFKNLIWDMLELYHDTKESIALNNINWKSQEDLRLMVYDFFIGTFQNTQYSLILAEEQLSNEEWWKTTKSLNLEKSSNITKEQISETVNGYLNDIRINLIFNTFKNLEVFMRDLCRNIFTKETNCFEKFYKIRNSIIDFSELNGDNNSKDFIELFQNIRNTMHNNGFHFNKNEKIIYKEKLYIFENGKPIDFISLEFLRLLFNDTNTLLTAIINSNNIKNIEKITSLYSKIDFIKQ